MARRSHVDMEGVDGRIVLGGNHYPDYLTVSGDLHRFDPHPVKQFIQTNPGFLLQ